MLGHVGQSGVSGRDEVIEPLLEIMRFASFLALELGARDSKYNSV